MTYDYKTSQYHADYSANATPAILQTEMARIYNNFSDIDGSYIHAATIADTALVNNPVTARGETIPDCKTSSTGLTFTVPSSTLAATIAAGVAYISGTRVSMSATAKTFTQNKDTYVDLNTSGTYTYTEVANKAAEPALSANNIRLLKVVTSTVITAVENLALIAPTYTRCGKYHKENIRLYYKDADKVTVSAGVISIWNKARTKYVVCENTSATDSAALTLSANTVYYVYAIPTYNSGFSIVASTTAPTTTTNHPDYPYSRCVGSFSTAAGGATIIPFKYIDNVCYYDANVSIVALGTVTKDTWTSTNAIKISDKAKCGIFNFNGSGNVGSGKYYKLYVKEYSDADTNYLTLTNYRDNIGNIEFNIVAKVPVGFHSTDLKIRYNAYSNSSSETFYLGINLLGYIEALDE